MMEERAISSLAVAFLSYCPSPWDPQNLVLGGPLWLRIVKGLLSPMFYTEALVASNDDILLERGFRARLLRNLDNISKAIWSHLKFFS